jgi:hypothetical protein
MNVERLHLILRATYDAVTKAGLVADIGGLTTSLQNQVNDPATAALGIAEAIQLTAISRAEDNKACILKATETLPRISGLVVKKTRTRAVPAAILATWQGQTRPIIVEVDTVAAGAEETYSYMCVMTKGSAYVRRVMI